ncbi:MAG TPA: hypothetical protein VIT24_02905 [Acidimicrobiales bacterium]|jgi:hypothetical protein
MTETTEKYDAESITEALALIDRGLGTLLDRQLVSTNEVADLLLDVRTLLSKPSEELVSTN